MAGLALGCVALGLLLGQWQLERADAKRVREQLIADRQDLPPHRIQSVDDLGSDVSHRRIVTVGVYDAEQQFLLDNRTRAGRPGCEVITPFRVAGAGGLTLLVNRGWVPYDGRRHPQAALEPPKDPVRIRGTWYRPTGQPVRLGPSRERYLPDVVRVQDLAAIREGPSAGPWPEGTLRLGSESAGAYRTDWPAVGLDPARHVGYAVQWFGLAVVAGVFAMLFARAGTAPRPASNDTTPPKP
jgi:cytochrome oxidase assembly protein ShyY1